MIAQLVVDDGVSSRGHRKNVFGADFSYVGIGVADHKVYEKTIVFDYAGGVGEKGSKAKSGSSSAAMPSSSSGKKTKLDQEYEDCSNGKD